MQVQGAPSGLAHPTNPHWRLQWMAGWDAQNRLENKEEMMNRAYEIKLQQEDDDPTWEQRGGRLFSPKLRGSSTQNKEPY